MTNGVRGARTFGGCNWPKGVAVCTDQRMRCRVREHHASPPRCPDARPSNLLGRSIAEVPALTQRIREKVSRTLDDLRERAEAAAEVLRRQLPGLRPEPARVPVRVNH